MKRSQKSQHPLLKFDCYFFQGVPEKFIYVYVFLCFLIIGRLLEGYWDDIKESFGAH